MSLDQPFLGFLITSMVFMWLTFIQHDYMPDIISTSQIFSFNFPNKPTRYKILSVSFGKHGDWDSLLSKLKKKMISVITENSYKCYSFIWFLLQVWLGFHDWLWKRRWCNTKNVFLVSKSICIQLLHEKQRNAHRTGMLSVWMRCVCKGLTSLMHQQYHLCLL